MPADFERAVKEGARVRTISGPNKQYGLKRGEYRRIAFLKGKSHLGEIKTKKEN
jgi:hypothetical protein